MNNLNFQEFPGWSDYIFDLKHMLGRRLRQLDSRGGNSRRDYAALKIQGAMQKYYVWKKLSVIQTALSEAYKREGKSRRRDSVSRPFSGDYFNQPHNSWKSVDASRAIFFVLDFYEGRRESNIVYVDVACGQVMSHPSGHEPPEGSPTGRSKRQCATVCHQLRCLGL